MKTTNKCAAIAFAFGLIATGGVAMLLPGAHIAVYAVVFVFLTAGAFKGATDFSLKRKQLG